MTDQMVETSYTVIKMRQILMVNKTKAEYYITPSQHRNFILTQSGNWCYTVFCLGFSGAFQSYG